MDYLGSFLEQFTEYQVFALSLPIEELELFFSKLEAVLILVRTKTGFNFAPIVLQKSLFCPSDEFMVIFHKVNTIDIKLAKVA